MSMKLSRITCAGAIVGAALLSACAEQAPDAVPATDNAVEASPLMSSRKAGTSITVDERAETSPVLADYNAQLAALGAPVRILKADLIVDPKSWEGSSTTLIAEDRARGIGIEWVARDPRRGGRVGLTYAFDLVGSRPFTRNPDGSGLRQATFAELETQLEEGLTAWRNETCSDAPLTRVPVGPTVDPDFLDNFFLGRPEVPNRVLAFGEVADLVQGGWQPNSFFTAFAGAAGSGIIGVAFTFNWVDDAGNPTDIDRNRIDDAALVEIYYNTRFAWGNSGAANVVDYYSIIAHETGHGLGLAHFGKVFYTRQAAADGLQLEDIKYAPLALMNAVYVTGRSEIAGTDRSSFCQIWANKN
jgi:hypothetical protein